MDMSLLGHFFSDTGFKSRDRTSAPVQESLLSTNTLNPVFHSTSSFSSFRFLLRGATGTGVPTESGVSNLYGSFVLGDGDLEVTGDVSSSRSRHCVDGRLRGNRLSEEGGHVQSSLMFARTSLLACWMAADRRRRVCEFDLSDLRLSEEGDREVGKELSEGAMLCMGVV